MFEVRGIGMPQIVRMMKAVGRRRLILFGKFNNGFQQRPRPDYNFTIRHLTTLPPFHSSTTTTTTTRHLNYNYNCKLNCYKYQRRWFLGCGDGDEGSSLSKLHEERLVIGYSPDQIYAVVAAVDLYEDFLPWCQRSDILRRFPDGSFDAELEIGFKFLIESYVSHVVLEKPKMIKTTASESNLFEHLINVWEFSPGPTPDTCSVYFLVDFKFRSPLYRQVASMFFREVVTRLVSSFIDRCRLIYGPGATIEQKA